MASRLSVLQRESELIKEMINKMLEPYGVDMNYVSANPHIDNEPWFQHFTHTQKEEDEWLEWSYKRAKEVLKRDRQYCKKFVDYINFMYGLKIKNNEQII